MLRLPILLGRACGQLTIPPSESSRRDAGLEPDVPAAGLALIASRAATGGDGRTMFGEQAGGGGAELVEEFDDVKPAPVPSSAITCTLEAGFEDQGAIVTIDGTAVVVPPPR